MSETTVVRTLWQLQLRLGFLLALRRGVEGIAGQLERIQTCEVPCRPVHSISFQGIDSESKRSHPHFETVCLDRFSFASRAINFCLRHAIAFAEITKTR